MGHIVDRTHRDLSNEDIGLITHAYHSWRGEEGAGEYADVPGFCATARLEEIRKYNHVLTPGHYVGTEVAEVDLEPFEDKMATARRSIERTDGAGADAQYHYLPESGRARVW